MTFRLVGLHGPIGAGKSTLARMLATALTSHGLKVARYSFSTPIKTLMNALFDWDDRHSFGALKEVIDPVWGVSPRHVYRHFGTEFGRALIQDLWLRKAYQQVGRQDVLIIDDVRFPNEAQWIRDNGLLIHVIRANRNNPLPVHESDRPLPAVDEDKIVVATDLCELEHEAARMVGVIKKGEINAVAA